MQRWADDAPTGHGSKADTLDAQVVGGEAAAPRGTGLDTPAGLDLPGQPPLTRLPVCANCDLAAPFPERGPCPACGWDPFTAHGSPHIQRPCVWRGQSVWWKPVTWFSGRWVARPFVDEGKDLRVELERQRARTARALDEMRAAAAEELRILRRLRTLTTRRTPR